MLLSKLSLHWPADSLVCIKLPSVIYWKREMCPELQDGALQDALQLLVVEETRCPTSSY